MLPARERLKERIKLGTVADQTMDFLRALADVEASKGGDPGRGWKLTCTRVPIPIPAQATARG